MNFPKPKKGSLPYREGETAWTKAEIAGVRAELDEELAILNAELTTMEADLQDLMTEAVDSAGDDQADSGTKTFEREHEISLTASVRDMRDQVAMAIKLLAQGDYGTCTNCGQPIGKLRIQAFPRATLCLSCKQKQERR